jgi:4-amino-4-deoxy-L-arabinose transferase-like glycosyltransferase
LRIALPLLAAAALLLPGLGALDLWAPDEPRYGQIAEELRSFEHGARGLWLLHLNDEPYTQKPPLYFWLAALAGAIPGRVSELAARLPSALAAIALVALTAAFGRRLFAAPGRASAAHLVDAGPWGALVLLTAIRFAHLGRRVQLDVLLALLETVALYAYWRLWSSRETAAADGRLLFLLHGAIALAVLTKGPVGLLPYAVIAVHLAWEGRLDALRRWLPLWGVALAVLPGLVWLSGAVWLAPAGFFEEAIVTNLGPRLIGGGDHDRAFYYYLYQLPADFLPWTPLLLFALYLGWHQSRRAPSVTPSERVDADAWRFLLGWLALFVVFFSAMSGKRGSYLLPAFPAAALLCGAALAQATRPVLRWLEWGWGGLACALLIAGLLASSIAPELVAGIPARASALGVALGATGLGVLIWQRARGAPPGQRIAWLLVFVIALESGLFLGVLPALDERKSPRPIAALVANHSDTHERVGVFRHSALAGGVAYYSGREVVALESEQDVIRFVGAGGGLVVARTRDMNVLNEIVPVRVLGHARQGRRRLEVARAAEVTVPTTR